MTARPQHTPGSLADALNACRPGIGAPESEHVGWNAAVDISFDLLAACEAEESAEAEFRDNPGIGSRLALDNAKRLRCDAIRKARGTE